MQDQALALALTALKAFPLYLLAAAVVGRLVARAVAGALVRR